MAAQTNFIDIATIWLHAGKGGDGAVSFHREKFVAAGGPDGGDGGRGGDIIFVADDHLSTLMDFRYKRKYVAPEGGKGGASLCHGKNAENLVIKVPLGTVIKDAESGLVIADLSDHTPVTIAKGGRGGYGNAHFATPTRQIPKFAKPGMPGEDLQVTLELKLIADVGLIGFPNVGKSTLLSVISKARPKIADYHFTTLTPNLGVVYVGEGESFVAADIPGIIEGAAEGAGLGHDFLRHIERCLSLIHISLYFHICSSPECLRWHIAHAGPDAGNNYSVRGHPLYLGAFRVYFTFLHSIPLGVPPVHSFLLRPMPTGAQRSACYTSMALMGHISWQQ